MKYNNLITEKQKLESRLKEINSELDGMDYEIYKGKFEKALRLLTEISTDYLTSYVSGEIECEECNNLIDVDFVILIDALKEIKEKEFCK